MRSRWVVAGCVSVGVSGILSCARMGPGPGVHGPDHRVMLDVAKFNASPPCGQKVEDWLTIWTDDVPGDTLARRVQFEVKNAGDQDAVEINKKAASDNPANWANIKLGKAHAAEPTPRVPKGQLQQGEYRWQYEIVFKLGDGRSCTIDPGICIRTQMGGCSF